MPRLRDLPSIDRLLRSPKLAFLVHAHGAETIKQSLRSIQAAWRATGEVPEWATDPEEYARRLEDQLAGASYRPVFNLTGTMIHTNLGRALLDPEMFRSIEPLVTRPVNLEFDLASGRRGDRDRVVESRLQVLTGAPAATVVNNNAAALMLCLNTAALGREVIVSRGELIEIGGSFRLPELMERAGCRLVEVGTTNRTHLRDYQAAIGERTGMLLKVHPSNYHISGFTHDVGVAELAALAREHRLPLCVDLGSGTLVDLRKWGLPHEPMPQEILAQGADLVTFSGDKLLGSVQAGILAFLDRTLRLYENPERLAERLPLLRSLTRTLGELENQGEVLARSLETVLGDFDVRLVPSEVQIGSGSLPNQRIASRAVRITHDDPSEVRRLGERLRRLATPVIGRLHQEAVWLDVRGAEPLDELIEVLHGLAAP
jgi:L-seryl-tRNA(Ser) seleniumtransferase